MNINAFNEGKTFKTKCSFQLLLDLLIILSSVAMTRDLPEYQASYG